MKNPDEMTDVYSGSAASPKRPLSTLFSDKKMMLIATGTVLAGGSTLAWGLSPKGNPPKAPEPRGTVLPTEPASELPGGVLSHGQTWPVQGGTITPSDEVQIGLVNESLTFDQAFQAARAETGPGGIFIWHSQVYNTYQREEWMGLSLAQRQEFLADVGFKPTLPASPEGQPHTGSSHDYQAPEVEPVDGLVNGQRWIGYDENGDGMIDTIVRTDPNGQIVITTDAKGDDGLDREVILDPITRDIIQITNLSEPLYISTEQFESFIQQHELDGRNATQTGSDQPEPTYPTASTDPEETDEDNATIDYQNDADSEM